jgi:integrase
MLNHLAGRKVKPLSPASLRKVRGTLQRVLALAMRRGKVSRNVALDAVIVAQAPPAKRRVLQPDDARRLLAALQSEPNGAMFALSLRIGLRPGEAAALHWEDLDLDAGVVHVRRGVRQKRGRPEVVDVLKTVGSIRDIEMPSELVAWLGEHRRQQIEERLAAKSWDDERLVFASPEGRVLVPLTMRHLLVDICDRAGVPVLRPNELRHSCTSLLSDEGVPIEQISDLLGHTSTRMVEMTYQHRLRPIVSVAARSSWATTGEQ